MPQIEDVLDLLAVHFIALELEFLVEALVGEEDPVIVIQNYEIGAYREDDAVVQLDEIINLLLLGRHDAVQVPSGCHELPLYVIKIAYDLDLPVRLGELSLLEIRDDLLDVIDRLAVIDPVTHEKEECPDNEHQYDASGEDVDHFTMDDMIPGIEEKQGTYDGAVGNDEDNEFDKIESHAILCDTGLLNNI